MRSAQVYRASDKVSNRFALCGTASRSVRIIHTHGNSIGESVSSAFDGISGKGFRILPAKPAPPKPAVSATASFFSRTRRVAPSAI